MREIAVEEIREVMEKPDHVTLKGLCKAFWILLMVNWGVIGGM